METTNTQIYTVSADAETWHKDTCVRGVYGHTCHQTPTANRIIDWLIYGTRENEKTPLQSNLENGEERLKKLTYILEMK